MRVETAADARDVVRSDTGRFIHEITVTTDGFIAVTPFDADDAAGPRRLIGVSATPDRPPSPRVVAPGKDMFIREATASLDISVEAADDIGLRSLELRYTKVAGAGESFTFTEGEVPLTIARASARQWSGTGVLPLGALGLDVGDMVVYRAVATDTRPGSQPVESDAFIVEIVSVNEAMAEGFAIDDTQDKYAISQQMVILKTERLIERTKTRPAPDAETVLLEALMIAAEQRSVRAELVFMTGGHFEDEFVEAAHEHEIADGRFGNEGRADLGRAIRDMSRASAELTEGNLAAALVAEKSALDAMQRALARRRFILRTLTQRDSLDEARRLSGTLVDLGRARRDPARQAASPLVEAVRAGLDALAPVITRDAMSASDAATVGAVGESLLRAAAGEPAAIDLAAALSAVEAAVTAGRPAEARQALSSAAARMAALLRADTPLASPGDPGDLHRLRGAMADVSRRGGR